MLEAVVASYATDVAFVLGEFVFSGSPSQVVKQSVQIDVDHGRGLVVATVRRRPPKVDGLNHLQS